MLFFLNIAFVLISTKQSNEKTRVENADAGLHPERSELLSFTRGELSLLRDPYFRVLRETDQFIEVESVNTKHCWYVFKNTIEQHMTITLYHKHGIDKPYYHKQKTCRTVAEAVEVAKSHDNYVLEQLRIKAEKPPVKGIRTLKVYGQSGYKYQETPTIQLKGKWLEEYGFNIGENYQVLCENGKLTLTAIE